MSVKTEPPKKKRKASKKTKKSWRKNTDIAEVEEFLEDQRLEDRLGGAFHERKDEDLFVVDKGEEEEAPKISGRVLRKKKLAEKPLKCFQNLTVTSGVKDPKKGRNPRRTPDQRKNPTVKAAEKDRVLKGVLKAKEITAKRHREAQTQAKKAAVAAMATQRRTKFDFDLWATKDKREIDAQVLEQNDWLEHNTKLHNLKNTRKLKRSLPKDLNEKTSTLPAVEPPHAGSSYNPSYKDHQDLLWKAAIVEVNKEKAAHKIEFHTTRMFPDKNDAPTAQTWLEEMKEGLEEEDEEEAAEEEEEEEEKSSSAKLKTRKQRRKLREKRAEDHKTKFAKLEKQKSQDIFRLKKMNKMLRAQERLTSKNMEKRKLAKVMKLQGALKLSANKFEEPEVDLKLSDELVGSLRELKPEGNILFDRYKSLQKRNVIETTAKQKPVRKNRRHKKAEKRSHKMPWETALNVKK